MACGIFNRIGSPGRIWVTLRILCGFDALLSRYEFNWDCEKNSTISRYPASHGTDANRRVVFGAHRVVVVKLVSHEPAKSVASISSKSTMFPILIYPYTVKPGDRKGFLRPPGFSYHHTTRGNNRTHGDHYTIRLGVTTITVTTVTFTVTITVTVIWCFCFHCASDLNRLVRFRRHRTRHRYWNITIRTNNIHIL